MKLCIHGKPVGKMCRCYVECGHQSIEDCERRIAAMGTMLEMAKGYSKLSFNLHLAASSCAKRVAEALGIADAHYLIPEQWD